MMADSADLRDIAAKAVKTVLNEIMSKVVTPEFSTRPPIWSPDDIICAN